MKSALTSSKSADVMTGFGITEPVPVPLGPESSPDPPDRESPVYGFEALVGKAGDLELVEGFERLSAVSTKHIKLIIRISKMIPFVPIFQDQKQEPVG